MTKQYTKYIFFILTIFISTDVSSSNNGIPLEHFACKSTGSSFSISPDGKYMLITNPSKDNICDIEMDYSKRVEDEMYDRGLLLMDLDTNETTVISSGVGGGRISSAGWLNNERIWYEPRYMMGRTKTARFAMDLDGSNKKMIYERKYGRNAFNYVYDIANDDPEHIFIIKIGRAHVRTPVTEKSRMPSSA